VPLAEALDITRQVAEGLACAHGQHIVHRDVKPANIFLNRDGLSKILDFGLAKLIRGSKVTKTGSTLGTAFYMSPEQAVGGKVDPRTDLWCLGVVLYEMVTGRLPFPGDKEQAILYGILNLDPEPVAVARSGLPRELDRIIGKCLAKDPAERYQSAAGLVSDLVALQRRMGRVSTVTWKTLENRTAKRRQSPWRRGFSGRGSLLAISTWLGRGR
jgi:serine/threonine-protein kinase